mmetsp:Transcript_1792/g.5088  ORF Transcript_1792/g.5088 Transcript_1792/m.5088 type:complete len:349 (-) Transcript_1792:135-1181(-)|eukprot:CAMPEP_0115855010 /NCGR_PEP_ID=MMETSP0287-20121206/14323_1 /TAXON_ID=412157 /ORGANISM="Chrysochromulina rotalis, Strain UIO044" /LENGTH=348 /DNA_ID=CAMNT_0003309153 /DNA_START=46 /DNA_END=1092 /DNA_ORIENTATION=-
MPATASRAQNQPTPEEQEPTVWQATKALGHALKRTLSFKSRKPVQPSAAVAAAAEQVAAAERAAAQAAEAEKAAKKAAEQAQKAVRAATNAAEQKAADEAAEKASAERATTEKASAERAAELARQKSLPGLPPRASDVRAAVDSLGAAIGRASRRRSSVTFASDVKTGAGLKPSPKQPRSIVGVVRRATKGNVEEPDYSSVVEIGRGAEPGLPPRASAVARAVDPLDRTDSGEEPGMPPRASAVARAVDPLDRTDSGELEENELPGAPPRASIVSRAMMRLVPRRSSDIPPPPPRASDVAAAVRGSRRERRQGRRLGTNANRMDDNDLALAVPGPPSTTDIAAAVRDL